jgi:serine phosphatase RsbU (regulator of sigma subunit)
LTALATRLIGVGRAQVSLLGSQQWVASTAGFTLPEGARNSPLSESLCSVTVASGAPLLIQDAPNHPWVRDLPPVRDDGVRRYVGVPLVSSTGITIGALCAYDGRRAPLPEDAETTLGDLAAAIMATLQLGTTNRELHAADEQLRQLQALTAQLSCAVSQSDVADAVVRHGIELITRHGVVGVLATDGTHVRTWPTSGLPRDLVQDFLLLPLDAATPLTHAIRTGRPVVVPTLTQIGDLFPGTLATHTATGTCCVLALPTRVADETLGAVAFGFESEHCIDDDVLTYARTVADLTGQALERARLYDREHDSARQLQHALLPPAPPELPGVRAAASYRPADSAHDIGGDWYDVFALPGGRVGLVIGDVMGHDLHAAAAMGRLHAMLRAIALTASGPAHSLDRLEDAITGLPGLALTTIGYGDYDPASGLLRYACAGHLPPLLVADGHARYLSEGRSMPLGVPSAASGTRPPRTDATVHVAPGSLLLWCTDGLVERRNEDIDTGLDALAHHAEQLHGADAHAHCDTIMSDMTDGQHLHDDIALLCVHLDRT